ncbi:hypothetical protein [Dickeya zeae]|uniref:hypothetical protein n=1 Tax=Dickeya zeae TaxID=204042 RepID=UPI0012686DC5|nr:hypothetical protein [Dickeya zeae]
MKKVISISIVATLMVVSGSAFSESGPGTVNYDIYSSTTLTKVGGASEFPGIVEPQVTKRGNFKMYNEFSGFETSVTYQDQKGQRCTFTAGYKLNNIGPVYSSSVQKSPSNANCSISLYGEKYGKPYRFTMSMNMY